MNITERWLLITYEPNLNNYEVSNYGNVKPINSTVNLIKRSNNGTPRVSLNSNYYSVARLVANAFLGSGKNKVMHIDYDKTNCRLDNLFYRVPITKVNKINIKAEAKKLNTTAYYLRKDLKIKAVKNLSIGTKLNTLKSNLVVTDKSYKKLSKIIDKLLLKPELDYLEMGLLKYLMDALLTYVEKTNE